MSAIKTCGACGRAFTAAAWQKLAPAAGGLTCEGYGDGNEWRQCPCESTILFVPATAEEVSHAA